MPRTRIFNLEDGQAVRIRLDDLMIPPSNRLERLKGDLKEFYSMRINKQWRVIFKWINGEPHVVRILDYH
jgi:toxin HigB-1